MLEIINQPWPWYVSGPLIGLTVPILLFIGNKSFGISSFFQNSIAACGVFNTVDYFKVDWKTQKWNFLFLLGIFLAGTVAFQLFDFQQGELSDSFKNYLTDKKITITPFFPIDYFQENLLSIKIVLLTFGGLFIGFGSRYAGGCTSGHAITGLSQLSLSSLIAVIGFFIGGLFATYFIMDNIL